MLPAVHRRACSPRDAAEPEVVVFPGDKRPERGFQGQNCVATPAPEQPGASPLWGLTPPPTPSERIEGPILVSREVDQRAASLVMALDPVALEQNQAPAAQPS